MGKSDRRIKRTQKLLQTALIELINECEYEMITVQAIVDRANVGRSTFYEHYDSKDDLFMDCHESIVDGFYELHSCAESLLQHEAPSKMTLAYQNLVKVQAMLNPIFHNNNGQLLLRRIRECSAEGIKNALYTNFDESKSKIPFNILANYLARAQLGLFQWWLEKRQTQALEELVQAFYRLQRAAIRDAFAEE